MSDDAPYHARVEVVTALSVTFSCPYCGADMEEEALDSADPDGLWRASEGGFRSCDGCGGLVELARVDPRLSFWREAGDRACDTLCLEAVSAPILARSDDGEGET